ncbi:heterotrimeric G-protein alpha subunit, GPA3-like protein [Mycena belliarum]|uniref:Heterotrimeric G-protein alpha subunit, GPA3-like protein n=1 Tax=Mycena belliarum TaxID=1033014 RepID=A0AAD6TV64_9AGAR|nr:heterotrimeric G-protein alpha subunit, GPA3-like protein [Mycena belliae]
MGNCISQKQFAEKQHSDIKVVGSDIKVVEPEKEYKILLLGSGEAGKSTILKQMKIIYQDGFSPEELAAYIPTIHKNVFDSIHAILKFLVISDMKFVRLPNRRLSQKVLHATSPTRAPVLLSPAMAKAIHQLFRDPIIPQLEYMRRDFYLMDNADYFLDAVLRIGKQGYVPTVADVLHARQPTTGISEMHFNMGRLPVHMFDVGGQRAERKQWIQCFESVSSIIFCTALSEYNQVLLEDKHQNRMTESLALFASLVNTSWFKNTSIILFLNKIDVFQAELRLCPLDVCFPKYTGDEENVNEAAAFILDQFMQKNRAGLNVYPHLTQATHMPNIRRVFTSVQQNILQNAVQDSVIL